MCMQDEEVFSLVYFLSNSSVLRSTEFQPHSKTVCADSGKYGTEDQTIFLEQLLIDIPALIFLSASVEFIF